ncbi:MAG: DNA gyrase subunit B [Mycoplasmataceae bacterium]|nr:MAG: DNA gyrase subunit B [Mycoplasmataceae bacterium]
MNQREDQEKDKVVVNHYSADQIQVLEDIEAVRKRPGMYIGSTGEQGVHHLVWEVIDNSIDEAVAGYGNKISVSLSEDKRIITVSDNGRGIPVEIHSKTKKSTLETVFTVLHSGGKFDHQIYQTSGGLHGVGVTAVNALSSFLKVQVKRDNKLAIQYFEEGIPKFLEIFDFKSEETGTSVEFTPDDKIFTGFTHFNEEIIKNRLKELAYLNPTLTLTFSEYSEDSKNINTVYHFPGGLANWIQDLNKNEYLENTVVFQDEWSNDKNDKNFFHLLLSFQYNKTHRTIVRSFCNNIKTEDGGTHVAGFETGLLAIYRELIKEKYPTLKVNIVKDDVLEGISAIVSIRIKDPQFIGQTKDKLSNEEVRKFAKEATYDLVQKFLKNNRDIAEIIVEKIINSASIRAKSEEHLDFLRDAKQNVVLPGKLSDCISKNTEINEIFIVEGESAGGSAKLGRDRNNQAVLSLKGKVTNAEKLEKTKVLKNDEIKNLINALGYSVTEIFQNEWNLEKLRYGKIIIMTDADVDGAHIALLLATFFFKYFPSLIENRKLYLAVSPLYRLQSSRKEVVYFFNDEELNAYKKNNSLRYDSIQRFKGLGEMNPKQLKETTMNPEKRVLHELFFSNLQEAEDQINRLMGIKSDERKLLLESGEHRDVQLIVSDESKVEVSQFALVNFLRYAYMVIEGRALPQVNDGLKPVQRRILYTLYQLNILPNKPFKKSAKIIGEVMGKYHPHGDSSIYQAMVKMTQDFNYRYPLVEGQGNFGSIDGDEAGAYRYTEARLTNYGMHVLGDIDFGTVDWKSNYDETETEPVILPSLLPNLLLNGSSGVAVGMSTNIPPHNIKEIIDASIALIKDSSLEISDLLQFIQGPDFPTGGVIVNAGDLKEIYEKGEGTIYVRSKVRLEDNLIFVTEIPFKVNKVSLVEEIDHLIKKKKIEGLKSVTDYSNWEGIDIRIKIENGYEPGIILNQLYNKTRLQSTFSVKLRSLEDEKPRIFNLKEVLQSFISKRLDNIQKKSIFLSNKNKRELDNASVQLFIVNNYQEIADIIKNAENDFSRDESLKARFELDQEKINQILDTPSNFRQFSNDRVKKLEEKIENLNKDQINLTELVEKEEIRKDFLINDLEVLKDKFIKDERKTSIIYSSRFVTEKQLVAKKDRLIVLNISEERKIDPLTGKTDKKLHSYINVCDPFKLSGTNSPSVGKEINKIAKGTENKKIIRTNTHADLWCFSNLGKIYIVPVYSLPLQQGKKYGTNLRESGILKLVENEIITNIVPVEDKYLETTKDKYLMILTRKGKIKKIDLSHIKNIFVSGKKVINIARFEDEISQVGFTSGNDEVIIFSKEGRYKYLEEKLIRTRGRGSYGSTGIKVRDNNYDQAAGMVIIREDVDKDKLLILGVTGDNLGRKTPLSKLRLSRRCGGVGQQAYKTQQKFLKDKKKRWCDVHASAIENHKIANCCDKNAGISAYIQCPSFKKIQKLIKDCVNCQARYLIKYNPLCSVGLINLDNQNHYIYIIAGKFVAFYDKNDFLHSNKAKKRSLYRGRDEIFVSDLFITSQISEDSDYLDEEEGDSEL